MQRIMIYITALIIIATLPYTNHFSNSFQFDDYPTITDNPSVTSLQNIPAFFSDPATTTGVANRAGFRPLLLSTFAVDYWLAGGYDPIIFHVTSFACFLTLLALMFLFLRKELRLGSGYSDLVAMSATAIFAVHPVVADCVNYIVQRGEILAGLGIMGGLLLYRDSPLAQRYFLYIIPPLLGCLSKEVGYVFPLLLGAYVWAHSPGNMFTREALWGAIRRTLPSAIFLFGFAFFFVYLRIPESTVAQVVSGNLSPSRYLATQMYIIPDYIRMVFLPIDLSGDTDWKVVETLTDPNIYVGVLSCLFLSVVALASLGSEHSRFIGFGVAWFVICLAPTSSISPLTEVRNNHRVFLSLMGLIPALLQGAIQLCGDRPASQRLLAALLPCTLVSFGYATYKRNMVWQTPDSFWKDVTEKSPRNGRGHMNYGLTFMARGDYPKALSEFEEALVYSPFYSSLYINMGIALTEVGEIERGRRYFLDGQRLAPGVESSYFFYGRWLASTAQYDEAVRQLKQALEINPRYREAALLLVDTYRNLNQNTEAKSLSKTMLSVLPTNAEFAAIDRSDNLADIPVFFANQKSESYYIDTMLALYNTKKFSECIALARLGLTSFKNSHLLYNNAAACALEVKNYSEAEAFASRAVELNPTFVLAQNNLRAIREQLRGSNPSSSQARALQ